MEEEKLHVTLDITSLMGGSAAPEENSPKDLKEKA